MYLPHDSHFIQAKNFYSWICFITQSPVSGPWFKHWAVLLHANMRNFLLSWKMPLQTDHEHNTTRARFCKYGGGGGYSRCSPVSWWLENKFHLMWLDFLSCSWLLPPPLIYSGSSRVVPWSCRLAINPSGTEGNDACHCEHTRWGPKAASKELEQQSFPNEM